MERCLPGVLQGRVILVDEYGHRQTGLFERLHDDVLKPAGISRQGQWFDSILGFIACEDLVKVRLDAFGRSPGHAHVEPYNGISLPLLLHLHNLQSLEEFFLPLEISMQSVNEQRLAESAGTAQVIVFVAVVHQFPDNVTLVYIHVVLLSYHIERLYAYR